MRYRSAAIVCSRCALTLSALLAVPRSPAATTTSFVWTNRGGGSWTNPANWSPRGVPGASDQATITHTQSLTVTLQANTTVSNLVLGSIGSQQTLSLNGYDLTVTNAQFAGGTLSGAGTLEITGPMTWSGGRMVGPGGTVVRTGGTLTISANAGDVRLEGCLLDNAGTTRWQSGRIITDGATVINNQSNALFEVSFDGVFSGFRTFTNAGLFRKTGGTGIMTIAGIFNNRGTNEVQAGTLSLTGGGRHRGTFLVASNAKLVFVAVATNSHRFDTASQVTGAGRVAFNGIGTPAPTNEFSGTFDISGMTTFGYGVAVNFNPAATLVNLGTNVSFSGGSAFFNSGEALSLSNLNLTAGVLGGTDTVTVTGPMVWMNSTLQGPGVLNANGGLTINANSSFTNDGPVWLDGRVLNNAGAAVWTAGQILTGHGSAIHNLAGATFEATGTNGVLTNFFGGASTFTNTGWFRKGSSSDRTQIQIPFHNAGGVEVQAGTLAFDLYLQTAGTTLLNGGQLAAARPLQIQGGLLQGTGSVWGSVSNAAVVHPGDGLGALNIQGDYAQTSAGTMQIDLHRLLTNANSISVTGAVALNGSLAITLPDSFYTNFGPVKPGSTNVFLTYGTESGVFSQTKYPTNLVGIRVDYTPAVAIVITNTPPLVTANVPDWTFPEMLLFTIDFADYLADAETPASGLTYSILTNWVQSPSDSAANVTLSNLSFVNGQLQWTPAEDQGPGTNLLAVQVCDPGTPALCVTQRFTLTVTEVNRRPTLVGTNGTILEGTDQVVDLGPWASDPDVPANGLGFVLVSIATTNPLFNVVTSTLPNLSFDTNNGRLTWTPAEEQGPSTNVFTVRVWDTNLWALTDQHLSFETNITVVVQEVNKPPVWTNIPPRTVGEHPQGIVPDPPELTLDLAPYAHDPDFPTNSFSFELVTILSTVLGSGETKIFTPTNLPPNFSLSSAGVLTWSPGEALGPSSNLLSVRALDTNAFDPVRPSLASTGYVTILVNETNLPPVWTNIPTMTVLDHRTFETNLAGYVTDPDIPANPLGRYTLVSFTPSPRPSKVPPSMDSNSGVFSWKIHQDEASPSDSPTFVATVAVWDTNRFDLANPTLSATTSFTIVVHDGGNLPPVWNNIPPSWIVEEGTTFAANLAQYASDRDFDELTFEFVSLTTTRPDTTDVETNTIAPPNLSLGTDDGMLEWILLEGRGPSTNVLTVEVKDEEGLTDYADFTIVVNEVNQPPMWTGVPAALGTMAEGTLLSTNLAQFAYDPDSPTNTLTFRLVSIAVTNSVTHAVTSSLPNLDLDPITGVLTWIPGEDQGPGTNVFTVRVQDTNRYALNNNQLAARTNFTLVINEVNTAPGFAHPTTGAVFHISAERPFALDNAAQDFDIPTNLLALDIVDPPAGAEFNPANGLFLWTPSITNVGLSYSVAVTARETNTADSLISTQRFRLVVEPGLRLVLPLAPDLVLEVGGTTNLIYRVEVSTNLSTFGNWTPWSLVTNPPATNPPGLRFRRTNAVAPAPSKFYRALIGP